MSEKNEVPLMTPTQAREIGDEVEWNADWSASLDAIYQGRAVVITAERLAALEGLLIAAKAMHADMLIRAEMGQRAAEKIVACGASAWINFSEAVDAAIAGEKT